MTEEPLNTLLSEDFLSKIDNIAKEDSIDAVKCILNLIPTPAVMISLRVVERILRDYYTELTGIYRLASDGRIS